MRLANKVALITGAAAGIGEATAALFIKEGAQVVLADRDLDKVRATAKRLGDNAHAVAADVSNSAQVKAMVDLTVSRFGGLDILVNNAGYGCLGTVVTLEEDIWDDLMNVNLKGVFLCSKHAVPQLAKRGKGSIVNLASTISVVGIPDRVGYVAAKGGVAAMTRAMAIDHAKEGIRVNSIAPGVIASSYYDRMFEQVPDPVAFKKALEARSPANRMGTPHEIATMALWLASDESSFATGAMFTVDGGFTAW
ncbi:MAG: SDR family oxidoreductase [Alcaligenaceae bacterium]|nr:MAG: SDR family oxidoreductase [Alcaligenaceae bacterium]